VRKFVGLTDMGKQNLWCFVHVVRAFGVVMGAKNIDFEGVERAGANDYN